MAITEVKIQSKIVRSVRTDWGYAFKMSNAYSAGIVDLFIALPPFVPCVIEVKDLKECTPKFDRDLGVTALQDIQLRQVSDVYLHSEWGRGAGGNPPVAVSGVLVALMHHGEHRLVGLPKDARRLDASYEGDPKCWRKRVARLGIEGGYYEIAPLLEAIGVNKIW